jgi:hypothetical protein
MERKPFDQVLHDENDAIAKEAVRSFLEAVWGYPVTEGGQYDVDLLIYEEDTICGYVEVERRHNWDKQHFPFDTLHIPERKRKFFHTGSAKPALCCEQGLQVGSVCAG